MIFKRLFTRAGWRIARDNFVELTSNRSSKPIDLFIGATMLILGIVHFIEGTATNHLTVLVVMSRHVPNYVVALINTLIGSYVLFGLLFQPKESEFLKRLDDIPKIGDPLRSYSETFSFMEARKNSLTICAGWNTLVFIWLYCAVPSLPSYVVPFLFACQCAMSVMRIRREQEMIRANVAKHAEVKHSMTLAGQMVELFGGLVHDASISTGARGTIPRIDGNANNQAG